MGGVRCLTSQSSCAQFYRQAPRAPMAVLLFENARDFVAAASASAVCEIPFTELVPIALDEQLAATRTPCAGPFAIMHVSRVVVMQPFSARDLTGTHAWPRRR